MGKTHEERILELEQQIAQLRTKIDALEVTAPWWERIAGTVEQDPGYKKAMQLGREYREAQRPGSKSAKQK
jgi:hypothetical protein